MRYYEIYEGEVVDNLYEKIVHRDTLKLNAGDWLDTVVATNPTKSEFFSRHFMQPNKDGNIPLLPSAAGVVLKNGDIVIGEGHSLSHEDICHYAGLDINDELYRLQIADKKVIVELWLDDTENSSDLSDKISEAEIKYNNLDEIRSIVGKATARFIPDWAIVIRLWTEYSSFVDV